MHRTEAARLAASIRSEPSVRAAHPVIRVAGEPEYGVRLIAGDEEWLICASRDWEALRPTLRLREPDPTRRRIPRRMPRSWD